MDQLKRLTTSKNYDKFDKKIKDKEFLMGRFYDATISSLLSPACSGKHGPNKKFVKSKLRKIMDAQLSIKEMLEGNNNEQNDAMQDENKKIKKTLDKSIPNQTYELYLPLHNLWTQYITSLIQKEYKYFQNRPNQQSKQLKVLRSDFHGSIIKVIDCKNETLIGLQGIVIKQTLRCFQIIVKNQQNKKKIILKSICIFLIETQNNSCFVINGSSLVFRPSDRIKHKFKFKKADQLNYHFLQVLDQLSKEKQQNQ